MRATDAVGRLGGEEFAVSLPCTDPEQGMAVAERLRQAINRLVVGEGTSSAQLSVCIGGAFLRTPQSFDRIYAVADANLYHSKRTAGIAAPSPRSRPAGAVISGRARRTSRSPSSTPAETRRPRQG